MNLSEMVARFWASPLDPDGDGKTSAIELIAFVGFVTVLTYIWSRILRSMLE